MDNNINDDVEFLDSTPVENTSNNNPSEEPVNNIFNLSPINDQNSGSVRYEDIKPRPVINPVAHDPVENIVPQVDENAPLINGDLPEEDRDLIGKQEIPNEEEVLEHASKAYQSNIFKSLIICILLGINEFFIGPRIILKYLAKYLSKVFSNMIMNSANITTIKLYSILYVSVILGFLIYFFVIFVYSVINVIKKGFELENFKRRAFELFAYSLLFSIFVCTVSVYTDFNILQYVEKIITFNGLIYKTSLML